MVTINATSATAGIGNATLVIEDDLVLELQEEIVIDVMDASDDALNITGSDPLIIGITDNEGPGES